MKHLTFENFASAAILVALTCVATGVLAEEPAPYEPKPGDVYSIDKDGKPVKIDPSKLWIQSVQWDAASNSYELGLKNDGTVVWRKRQ